MRRKAANGNPKGNLLELERLAFVCFVPVFIRIICLLVLFRLLFMPFATHVSGLT